MNSTIDTIKNRRSIRRYSDVLLKKEDILGIIEAGKYAPSSHNSQPWQFTVIQDKELIDELSDDISSWYSSLVKLGTPIFFIRRVKKAVEEMKARVKSEKDLFFYHAPLVIIVHSKPGEFAAHNCSCAAQNMMLAARSLGIGSCWIGFADIVFNRSLKLKKRLGIPVSHRVHASISFGYPIKFPDKALPRKDSKVSWL